MAKRKKKEESSVPNLQDKLLEIDRELYALRDELSVQKKLEKPHLLRAKRKEKARILTLLTKQRQEGANGA